MFNQEKQEIPTIRVGFTTVHKKTAIEDSGLWSKVLLVAYRDLYAFPASHHYNTFDWFMSRAKDIGSFLWICYNYDFPVKNILREVQPRLAELYAEKLNASSRKNCVDLQLERLLAKRE